MIKKYLASFLLAVLVFCQISIFPVHAEPATESLLLVPVASPSIAEAVAGSKTYFEEWNETGITMDVPDRFWEVLAMYSLKMEGGTGTDYESIDYSSLTAIELSKYIFAMVIDGVDPKTVTDETSGLNAVELLKSWEAGEGYSKGAFVNPDNASDYASIYNAPFSLMALWIVGETIDKDAVDYLASNKGADGDYGGGTFYGTYYPGDIGTTSWVLTAAKMAGKTLPGESDSRTFMADGYATAKTYEDLDGCAAYVSWKLFEAMSKETLQPEAAFIANHFDTDRNVFTYEGVWSEDYCTKNCARALGEYTYGSLYLRLKEDYRSIVEKNRKAKENGGTDVSVDTAGEETTIVYESPASITENAVVIPSAGAVTGEWQYNAAENTWSFLAGGKRFTDCWVAAVNPYMGNKAAWFFFNTDGTMLTGWQQIPDRTGILRWYYLNPASDGWLGACWLNARTPDGYQVDADGAWVGSADKTSTIVTASETVSAASGQDETGRQEKIEVAVSVDGSLGASDGTHVFGASGAVTVTAGASVYQALKAFANEQGWTVGGSSSYVTSINGLKEKANGAFSGWTYTVNGETPSKSAGSYKLSDGDSVEWTFVERP